jgi:tRNA-2-methylthio-N6-dimethylallyladenosine synthase
LTKKRRLAEIIEKQAALSLERNQLDLGKIQEILIEGTSKRSENQLKGRNSANKVVIIPNKGYKKGDYVKVRIMECSAATLFGEVIS